MPPFHLVCGPNRNYEVSWGETGKKRSFGYREDALHEIDAFFRREHKSIVAFTVQEILDGEIARKLA